MTSDLFFTQLVTQSFSSGSSFGNLSSSATANQAGNTTGARDMSGGESSFEHTLQRVSDTKSTSSESAPSGGGQASSQEYATSSADPSDIAQQGAPTDNLLGVSQIHQAIGNDGTFDPDFSSGMNMLLAILNELQNVIMSDNPAGMQLQPGRGVDDAISMFFDALSTIGDQAAVGTGGSPGLLEKLQALLNQFKAAGENLHTTEIQNLFQTFDVAAAGDAALSESAKVAKTEELARLIQNLAALSTNGLTQAGDDVALSGSAKMIKTAEIARLIQNLAALSTNGLVQAGGDVVLSESAKIAKIAEIAGLIQNLAVLSTHGLVQAGGPNQTARAIDLAQTGNLTPNEKPVAADPAKVLTTTTGLSHGSSALTVAPGASQNAMLEHPNQDKQASIRTAEFVVPKAVSSGENAGVQLKVNEQTLASAPQANEVKIPLPGQKDIIGIQFNKAPEGGLNQDNPAPVLQTNSSVQQNDATLQNAKVFHLKSEGAASEAAAGKVAPTESGNQENGLSFNSQQQNDLRASERLSGSEQPEMVQKKFQAQTVDQIVQKAALHLKNGQNEVLINLKPDFLGQIRMQIITDSQQVTVRILTEFPVVKELIENNANQLRNDLQNHGLNIDKLEVSVSQHSDQQVADQNKAGDSAGKNSTANKTASEDGESDSRTAAEAASDSPDDDSNTRIDFFA